MLKCPYCGSYQTRVIGIDYYYNDKHEDYKRYRKCEDCGMRFKTVERYDENPTRRCGRK